MNAVSLRIESIATEVGRLHRAATPETSHYYCVERLADHVEALDCMLEPSAGELSKLVDVAEALSIVDARGAHLRSLLAR